MKFLLLLSLAMFSVGSYAGDDKMKHEDWNKKIDSMSLEDSKKMMKEKMDKKEEMHEKMEKCIDDAKDKDALKKCTMHHK